MDSLSLSLSLSPLARKRESFIEGGPIRSSAPPNLSPAHHPIIPLNRNQSFPLPFILSSSLIRPSFFLPSFLSLRSFSLFRPLRSRILNISNLSMRAHQHPLTSTPSSPPGAGRHSGFCSAYTDIGREVRNFPREERRWGGALSHEAAR